MGKSEKELAFLRDITIDGAYTQKFTDHFDDIFKLPKAENVLYLNAGTGNHAVLVCEALNEPDFTAVCENEELVKIAKAKCAGMGTKIDFRCDEPFSAFDLVIADGSFTPPIELKELINAAARLSLRKLAVLFPLSGSFGEIFSMLWEALMNEDLLEHSAEVEKLINALPTAVQIENAAQSAEVTAQKVFVKTETVEFENAEDFRTSSLLNDFLFPQWLAFLNEKDADRVVKAIGNIVETEHAEVPFRFTIKSAMLVGEMV